MVRQDSPDYTPSDASDTEPLEWALKPSLTFKITKSETSVNSCSYMEDKTVAIDQPAITIRPNTKWDDLSASVVALCPKDDNFAFPDNQFLDFSTEEHRLYVFIRKTSMGEQKKLRLRDERSLKGFQSKIPNIANATTKECSLLVVVHQLKAKAGQANGKTGGTMLPVVDKHVKDVKKVTREIMVQYQCFCSNGKNVGDLHHCFKDEAGRRFDMTYKDGHDWARNLLREREKLSEEGVPNDEIEAKAKITMDQPPPGLFDSSRLAKQARDRTPPPQQVQAAAPPIHVHIPQLPYPQVPPTLHMGAQPLAPLPQPAQIAGSKRGYSQLDDLFFPTPKKRHLGEDYKWHAMRDWYYRKYNEQVEESTMDALERSKAGYDQVMLLKDKDWDRVDVAPGTALAVKQLVSEFVQYHQDREATE